MNIKPRFAEIEADNRFWEWHPKEDEYLREYCGKQDRAEIALFLGRSFSAIFSRARRLGLSTAFRIQAPHSKRCCVCKKLFTPENSSAYRRKIGHGPCKLCAKGKHSAWRKNLKLEVFSKYCDGVPYCQCTGCRNGKDNPVHIGALQMDHVFGGGSRHLNTRGGRIGGTELYVYLKNNDYPKGFQVLCANCNGPAAKGNRERCPFHGQPH